MTSAARKPAPEKKPKLPKPPPTVVDWDAVIERFHAMMPRMAVWSDF